MSYTQIVLADKPAAFWMITAASGTSETDLSGNGKTATITEATDLIDRGYRPLVTGTDTDRAYRFYSYNHKLSYPNLELWEANRDHLPFTIEFTFQPVTSTAKTAYIFNPQESNGSYVPDNGIFTKNNTLFFVTSNGSSAAPATKKTVVSYQLPALAQTYHVIATYENDKMSLYVDGQIVGTENITAGQVWTHTNANYITQTPARAADTDRPEILLDAVSVYKSALTKTSINNHYVYSTPNNSELDIVNGLGGKLIKINDEDRVKNVDFSARDTYNWQGSYVNLTDVYRNGDGIALKKIDPLKIMTTPTDQGNLFTANQASIETDLTGLTSFGQGAIVRSTASSLHGSASAQVTAAASPNPTTFGTSNSPPHAVKVKPNTTYTLVFWVRQAVSNTRNWAVSNWNVTSTGLTHPDGGGGAGTSIPLNGTSWTKITKTFTTVANPSEDIYVCGYVRTANALTGEVYYFDCVGLFEGGHSNWSMPETFTANRDVSNELTNLLTYNQATVEIDATGLSIGTNGASGQKITSQSYSGTGSYQFQSAAAGDFRARISGNFTNIIPGQTYTLTSKFKMAATGRNVFVGIDWYDSASAFISASTGGSVAATSSAWTQAYSTGTAPANASGAVLVFVVAAAAAAAEIAYIDEMCFARGSSQAFTLPRMKDADELKIYQSEYGLIENFGEHSGGNVGGFGGYFTVTTAENDNIAEQVVASAFNSNKTSIIEVVKKTDKSLYLRYIAKDPDGVITTKETVWGAISSLLDTQVYFYVEFANDLVTLYINTTASPAIVQVETLDSPQFDAAASMHLGAGWDKTRCWNGSYAWIKIYNDVQDSANFTANKTSVNGYTLKMTEVTRLNVSQQGTALVTIPTGTDGTEEISQTRLSWTPENPTTNYTTHSTDGALYYPSSVNNSVSKNGYLWRNLAINPSYENTTRNPAYKGSQYSWIVSYYTATLTETSTGSSGSSTRMFGQTGLKVDVPNQGTSAGSIHMAAQSIPRGSVFSAGCWVKVDVGVNYYVGARWYSLPYTYTGEAATLSGLRVGTGNWEWVTITSAAINNPTTDMFLPGIEVTITANQGSTKTYYIDGVVIVEGSTPPPYYFDGDQPGCYWEGLRNASPSRMVAMAEDVNIASNSNMEGSQGWTTWNGGMTVVYSNERSYEGSTSVKAVCTDYTIGNQLRVRNSPLDNRQALLGTAYIPCLPGETLYAGAMMLVTVPSTATQAQCTFEYVNGAGTLIGGYSNVVSIPATGVWTEITHTHTVPATAVGVVLHWDLKTLTANGATYYLDKAYCYRAVSGQSISSPTYKDGNSDGWTWGTYNSSSKYCSASYNSQFRSTLPELIYAKSVLSTDDSVYGITRIDDLKLEAFLDENQFGENTFDQIDLANDVNVSGSRSQIVRQPAYSGFYSGDGSYGLIWPETPFATAGGANPDKLTEPRQVSSIEFWLRPEAQGYYYVNQGSSTSYIRYLDSGGFTTSGGTLYVDGAATSNGATSTTWYNRWHHIVLVFSSPIVLGKYTPTQNSILSYNEATLDSSVGNWRVGYNPGALTKTEGLAAGDLQGPGEYKVTFTSGTGVSQVNLTHATPYTPVTAGDQYYAQLWIRTNRTQSLKLGMDWYTATPTYINTTYSPGAPLTSCVAGVWTLLTASTPASATATQGDLTVPTNPVSGDTYEIDMAFWSKGESAPPEWVAPGSGLSILGEYHTSGITTSARYQNVSYYQTALSAGQALANYKAYLGDTSGAVILDNPGGRTLIDKPNLNMLTDNQASIEIDQTGLSTSTNSTGGTLSTAQYLHGSSSWQFQSSGSGDFRGRTNPAGNTSPLLVNQGVPYTASAYFKMASASRNVRVDIDWYTDSAYVSTSVGSTASATSSGWAQAYITAVPPATATRATILLYVLSAAGAGEIVYIDQIGFWEGYSTEWHLPSTQLPNPFTLSTTWDTVLVELD